MFMSEVEKAREVAKIAEGDMEKSIDPTVYDITITNNSYFVFSMYEKKIVRVSDLSLEREHKFIAEHVGYGNKMKLVQLTAPHIVMWQFREDKRELYSTAIDLSDCTVTDLDLKIDDNGKEYIEVCPLWYCEWWVNDDFTLSTPTASQMEYVAKLYDFEKTLTHQGDTK